MSSPRLKFHAFTMFLTPAHWQLYPLWDGGRREGVFRILLGPLVLRFSWNYVYPE